MDFQVSFLLCRSLILVLVLDWPAHYKPTQGIFQCLYSNELELLFWYPAYSEGKDLYHPGQEQRWAFLSRMTTVAS